MLRRHSATARPMVAEPRPAAPPMQLARWSMPRPRRDGPLTNSIGNTLDVVVVRPNAFHSGSTIASSAATTNGNAAGSTPAIAALMATSSIVATPLTGGSTHNGWSAAYGDVTSNASTASSVAGSNGNPSLQCSSRANSYCARASAGTSTGSDVSVTTAPRAVRAPAGRTPRRSRAARPPVAPRAGTGARAP